MNQEELLKRLNQTPIRLNAELMRLHLRDFNSTIQSAEAHVKQEMKSKGMDIEKGFMKDVNVVKYINEHLIIKHREYQAIDENKKINLSILEDMFPSEPFIIAYIYHRRYNSLIKRYESILAYEKSGYIQPTFAINSNGYIYTSKPALLLSQNNLKCYLDCYSYTFDSLEDAMNAIENAKVDTEIITILMSTVYYKNNKYKHEKEERRQALLSKINKECDFMPLEDYYYEFTLSDLGFGRE